MTEQTNAYVMFELRTNVDRFRGTGEVNDAVLVAKPSRSDAPLEYAANFDTALRTDFLRTPENRVIVRRSVADALDQVGPRLPRTPVRLFDSDLETRARRLGDRTNDDFVALRLPELVGELDYTRAKATPRSVYASRPSKNPVLECDATVPALFHYGGKATLFVSARAVSVVEDAQGVDVGDGRGLRRDAGATKTMRQIAAGAAPPSDLSAVDLSARDSHGCGLLFYAAESGRADWLEALLAAGAEVDARNAREMTPLMAAAYRGQGEVVEALIAAGADEKARDRAGWSVSQWTAFRGHRELAWRFRHIDGADGAPPPLRVAVLRGHLDLVSRFVDAAEASDIEAELVAALEASLDSASDTAVLADVIERLVIEGAKVADSRVDARRLIQLAAFQGRLELLRKLIESGIDVDGADESGETALARIADAPHATAAELGPFIAELLAAGADPVATSAYGNSPIKNAERRLARAEAGGTATPEQLDAMRSNLELLRQAAARLR